MISNNISKDLKNEIVWILKDSLRTKRAKELLDTEMKGSKGSLGDS